MAERRGDQSREWCSGNRRARAHPPPTSCVRMDAPRVGTARSSASHRHPPAHPPAHPRTHGRTLQLGCDGWGRRRQRHGFRSPSRALRRASAGACAALSCRWAGWKGNKGPAPEASTLIHETTAGERMGGRLLRRHPGNRHRGMGRRRGMPGIWAEEERGQRKWRQREGLPRIRGPRVRGSATGPEAPQEDQPE